MSPALQDVPTAPLDAGGFGSAGYRIWAHLLLTATFVLAAYDRQVIGVLVEPIKRDLHLSDLRMGLVQGFAFALCYAVAALPVAWAIDRWIRMRIVGLCVGLWSVGVAVSGLASGFGTLVAGRAATAVSEAGYSPGALSLLGDTFPRRTVSRATALYLTAPFLGLGLALFVGGSLLRHFERTGGLGVSIVGRLAPWQAVLLVSAFPGIVLAFLLLTTLREPPRRDRAVGAAADGPVPDATGSVTLRGVLRRHGHFLIPYIGGCTALLSILYTLAAWSASLLARAYSVGAAAAGAAIGPGVLLAGIAGPVVASALLAGSDVPRLLRRMCAMAAVAGGSAAIMSAMLPAIHSLRGTVALVSAIVFAVSIVAPLVVAPIQLLVPSSARGRFHASASFVFTLVAGGAGPAIAGLITDRVLGNEALLGTALSIECSCAGGIGVTLILLATRRLEPVAGATSRTGGYGGSPR